MKKIVPTLLLCIGLLPLYGNDTLSLASTIESVTVFFSGATVQRSVELKRPKGVSFVVLEGLPLQADLNSLNIREVEGMNILAIRQLAHPAGRPKNIASKDPVSKAHELELDLALRRLAEIDNRLEVLKIEEDYLRANGQLQSKSGASQLDELKRLASYIGQRIYTIRLERIDLREEGSDLSKKAEGIRDRMNRHANQPTKESKGLRILLQVDCETAIEGKLDISYFVPSANWVPAYDFKVNNQQAPMTIFYKAVVNQSTGEDWEDVKLVLSMANPKLENAEPERIKWDLSQGFPYGRKAKPVFAPGSAGGFSGTVVDEDSGEPLPFVNVIVYKDGAQLTGGTTDFDGRYTIKPIDPGSYDIGFYYVGYNEKRINGVQVQPSRMSFLNTELQAGVQIDEVQVVSHSVPLIARDGGSSGGTVSTRGRSQYVVRGTSALPVRNVDGIAMRATDRIREEQLRGVKRQNLAVLQYELEQAHTIASDGKDYTLKIRSTTVDTDYRHVVVPVVDPDVYLMASVSDWEELNLTEGDAGIFYDQTYTGKTWLNPAQFSDTLSFSLGRDKAISVKRDEKRESYEKKFLGNTIKETLVYTIHLRNAKSTKVQLRVHDQIPTSSWKNVSVELLDAGGARVDEESGFLTWDLDLEAGESRELSFAFAVRRPR